jgi:hypothetical protein
MNARGLVAPLDVLFDFAPSGAAAGSNKSMNITNHCSYTVWPGILSGAAASSASALDTTGFELVPGESRSMSVPTGWSVLLWGRTLCSTNATTTGEFTCVTGDCGSGGKDCAGSGPSPPATLAQFTLDGSGGMHYYGVSLVDGFNLPVLVAPQGAGPGSNCVLAGCGVDLNAACPAELRVTLGTGGAVACKSACLAFGSPQYCCTGTYATRGTCKPSSYSEFFLNPLQNRLQASVPTGVQLHVRRRRLHLHLRRR